MELSQETLAQILGANQPQVSKIEHSTDLYLSTLRRYVEAVGGQLEITASFPEGSVRISQFNQIEPQEEALHEGGRSVVAEESIVLTSYTFGGSAITPQEMLVPRHYSGPATTVMRVEKDRNAYAWYVDALRSPDLASLTQDGGYVQTNGNENADSRYELAA